MSGTLQKPVLLEPEPDAAEAIGADWNPPALQRAAVGRSSLSYAIAGVAVLLASWLGFSILSAIIGFFAVSSIVGVAASLLAAAGLALVLFAAGREWRALRALHQVDALRGALLTGADVQAARSLALAWLQRLDDTPPACAAQIQAAEDVAQVRDALRRHLAEMLRTSTRAIGIRAATEVSALVAISPHASWDGLLVALRGLKAIRQVAQLHGLRPGPAVSLALLGRVTRAAVETAAIDVVSQAAADQFLGNVPVVKHLGAISGASTAAFRLYRLAQAAGRACTPLAE